MRLNVSTDYAIRLILYLAKIAKTVSSTKLSVAIGTSQRYLLQIGSKLRDGGLISVTYGSTGGFSLVKTAQEINLREIILIMEEKIEARPDFTSEQIGMPELKTLDTAYEYVDNVLGDILESITIESLIEQKIEKWYLAPCLMSAHNKGRGQSQ